MCIDGSEIFVMVQLPLERDVMWAKWPMRCYVEISAGKQILKCARVCGPTAHRKNYVGAAAVGVWMFT